MKFVKLINKRASLFLCEHGVEFSSRIIKGKPRSNFCPCERKEKTGRPNIHGELKTREYSSWKSMRQRCFNENNQAYRYYGGRGITVCKEWDDYSVFLRDMGKRPLKKSLDRINNDGNYEPTNCRWATQSEQIKNRRKKLGATRCDNRERLS